MFKSSKDSRKKNSKILLKWPYVGIFYTLNA